MTHRIPWSLLGLAMGCFAVGCGKSEAAVLPPIPLDPSAAATTDAAEIQTTGLGTVELAPDAAVVRLAVVARRQTVSDARSTAADSAHRVIDQLRDSGVPDEHMRTTSINISPSYNDHGRPQGYVASQTLRVRVMDVARVGVLVDEAVSAGGNFARVHGIDFEVAADKEARALARSRAVTNARLKADELAQHLGLELGKAFGVEEVPPNRPRGFDIAESHAATPVMTGQSKITARVLVRWRIGSS